MSNPLWTPLKDIRRDILELMNRHGIDELQLTATSSVNRYTDHRKLDTVDITLRIGNTRLSEQSENPDD